jgi:hypothetical protein
MSSKVVVCQASEVGKEDGGVTQGMKRSSALVGCSDKVSEADAVRREVRKPQLMFDTDDLPFLLI